MKTIVTAYTLKDVEFFKNLSADIIRFGEPLCYLRAYKNWTIEKISRAIDILKEADKKFQFQFLYSPVSLEEINYLSKVSKTFPFVPIVIETFGFITHFKNEKIIGTGIKLFNKKSISILKKYNCKGISLPENFTPVDITDFKKMIETEKYSTGLEYCFFGREKILKSWQCFSRRFVTEHKDFKDCGSICSEQLCAISDLDNPDIKLLIDGNLIVSSIINDKIENLKHYTDAGITDILLDLSYENEETRIDAINRCAEAVKNIKYVS